MVTESHSRLIAELEESTHLTWGGEALLACLSKLRDGGPTEYAIVDVLRAWPIDDGFKIVYLSPWGPEVGLTARLGELEYFQNFYQAEDDILTADEFGMEVADLYVAEPLGRYGDVLDFDSDGVGWWGSGHARLGDDLTVLPDESLHGSGIDVNGHHFEVTFGVHPE